MLNPFKKKTNEPETVMIHGREYPVAHPSITKDHFTGNYMLRDRGYRIATAVALHPSQGFMDVLEYAYTEEIARYAHLPILLCRGHVELRIEPEQLRIEGSGQIHPSQEREHLFLDDYNHKRMNNPKKFRAFNNQVRAFRDYDNPAVSDADKEAIRQRDIAFGVYSPTNKIFEGLHYTFGVELETSSGRLSEAEAKGLNLKCEFDGSLRETPDQRREDVLGGEYITGVLTGDAGMYQLQKVCNQLAKNCTINAKCGVHVHVGGLRFTKENIVYMYLLGIILQKEIFQMLPASRRSNSYCRSLKDLHLAAASLNNVKTPLAYDLLIDEYYNAIFNYVSHGKNPGKNCNKDHNHPLGSKCGYNKDTQRYCWLNFVTAMFNTKDNVNAYTLEFRPYQASLNYIKIKNWVKICIAFVNFAENHQLSIRRGYYLTKDGEKMPLTLDTILHASYPRTGKLVREFVQRRKDYFRTDVGDLETADYASDTEGIKSLSMKEAVCV